MTNNMPNKKHNDMKEHETHTICNKRLKQKGENLCCYCVPHSHCEFVTPQPKEQETDHSKDHKMNEDCYNSKRCMDSLEDETDSKESLSEEQREKWFNDYIQPYVDKQLQSQRELIVEGIKNIPD